MSRRRTNPELTIKALLALAVEFGVHVEWQFVDGPKGGYAHHIASADVGEARLTVFRLRRHRWCCIATWQDKTRKPRRGALYMTGARYFGSTARAAYLKALWAQPKATP